MAAERRWPVDKSAFYNERLKPELYVSPVAGHRPLGWSVPNLRVLQGGVKSCVPAEIYY